MKEKTYEKKQKQPKKVSMIKAKQPKQDIKVKTIQNDQKDLFNYLKEIPENCKSLVSRIDKQNLDQMKCHEWSATIPRMVTHHSKSTRNKCTTDLKFGTWT